MVNSSNVWVWNSRYTDGGQANENGFFNIPLVDGVYDIWVGAPNYDGFYARTSV